MRRNLPAVAVILTVATGCDNVTWGGASLALVPPPERSELLAEAPGLQAALQEPEEVLPELPEGPVLLAGARSGSTATLYVVGEVSGDALAELPDEGSVPGFRNHFVRERMSIGSAWTLFSEGVRVGRLVASEVGVDEDFCVARPTVTGTVELVPGASSATRLLALPADVAESRAYGDYASYSHDYDQRVASLSFATATIPEVGAAWPADGVLEIRRDIQAFRLAGEDAIAATFLLNDRLSVREAPETAYSIFVMGDEGPQGYQRTFAWYRPVDTEGKGAPRYFDHLDLNGDGSDEVILDVFGSDSRWFASLSRRGGSWVRTYQDSCGQTSGG